MAKGDNRLFIETEGGLVRAVWGPDPDTCVTVIDHDVREEGDAEELAEYKERVRELDRLRDAGELGEIF